MSHDSPPTDIPLYRIREEVAEHSAAVERASRDFEFWRASARHPGTALSQQVADSRERLDALLTTPELERGEPLAVHAPPTPRRSAHVDDHGSPRARLRVDAAHRRPPLRIFSPSSQL